MPPEPATESDASDLPPSGRRRRSRRALLAAFGTATAGALAGCSGGLVANTAEPTDGPGELHAGDWLSFGNGPRNANAVDGELPPARDRERLAETTLPFAPPVVHDGVAYAPLGDRVLAATPDGTERWTHSLAREDDDARPSEAADAAATVDREVSGAPAVDPEHGLLYVPTATPDATAPSAPEPAVVRALSLADGTTAWRARVGNGRTYGVTVSGGDAFVRSASACVRLGPDGTERWRTSLERLFYDAFELGDDTATHVPPAVVDDAVYVPDRNALAKLDAETGGERWRVDASVPFAAPVVDDRGVVQTGWRGVVAVTHDGAVRWRRDLHSQAAAAVEGGDVYVAAGDLHELDAETGETNWRADHPPDGTTPPVVADASVLAVGAFARAYRRDDGDDDSAGDVRWKAQVSPAEPYTSPVVAASHVLVNGIDHLSALTQESDEERENTTGG